MWKCKECGGEVFDYEIVKRKSKVLKDGETKEIDDMDTEEYWFECEICGADTRNDNRDIEDIAEWEE